MPVPDGVQVSIVLKWSCFQCGLHRVELSVPARGDEDVLTWVAAVATAAGEDHDRRSPDCVIDALGELLIPIGGAEKIGGPAVS